MVLLVAQFGLLTKNLAAESAKPSSPEPGSQQRVPVPSVEFVASEPIRFTLSPFCKGLSATLNPKSLGPVGVQAFRV